MYKLGKNSLNELEGVHPLLVFAVKEAIKITKQDFAVFDGLRTQREQEKLVARGVSKTNNSYHLYGLAVDLVPYVDGKLIWEYSDKDIKTNDKEITMGWYKEISTAMKTVIAEHNLPIEWGYDKWGWDLPHWQITSLEGKDARKVYDTRKLG